MKISLRELPEGRPEILEETIRPEDLDLEIGVMHFEAPIRVKAEAWKEKNDLTVQLNVSGRRRFTCSSCLDEFNNLFEKDLTLHYDIKGLETVTLDAEIRDEILLDHPIRVTCRPDCRGLCPACGANRNREQCSCRTQG